jgi:hypothetical protein
MKIAPIKASETGRRLYFTFALGYDFINNARKKISQVVEKNINLLVKSTVS